MAPGHRLNVIEAIASGWPFLCLHFLMTESYFEADYRENTGPIVNPDLGWQGAIVLGGRNEYSVRALPIVPIWSGVLVNMAFWTVLWFPPLNFHAIRNWLRRRRGRCAKCGYDLRGQFAAGCPECGWNRDEEAMKRSSDGASKGI